MTEQRIERSLRALSQAQPIQLTPQQWREVCSVPYEK